MNIIIYNVVQLCKYGTAKSRLAYIYASSLSYPSLAVRVYRKIWIQTGSFKWCASSLYLMVYLHNPHVNHSKWLHLDMLYSSSRWTSQNLFCIESTRFNRTFSRLILYIVWKADLINIFTFFERVFRIDSNFHYLSACLKLCFFFKIYFMILCNKAKLKNVLYLNLLADMCYHIKFSCYYTCYTIC